MATSLASRRGVGPAVARWRSGCRAWRSFQSGSRSTPLAVYRLSHCSESISRRLRALKAFLPWAMLIMFLFAMGVWIVLQPMQMRGTMPGAG